MALNIKLCLPASSKLSQHSAKDSLSAEEIPLGSLSLEGTVSNEVSLGRTLGFGKTLGLGAGTNRDRIIFVGGAVGACVEDKIAVGKVIFQCNFFVWAFFCSTNTAFHLQHQWATKIKKLISMLLLYYVFLLFTAWIQDRPAYYGFLFQIMPYYLFMHARSI